MNQAEVIFNSFSPEIQKEMISLVKSNLPKEEVPEAVRFDVPGHKVDGYVEGFVNVKEAAKFFQISDRVLYEMAARGDIPFYKPSGQMRFRLSELASAVRREKKEWIKEKPSQTTFTT